MRVCTRGYFYHLLINLKSFIMSKYLVGAGALLFIIIFSGVLATYVFSGILMFAGLVALCEGIPSVKWLLSRTGNVVDIIVFGFSIYALGGMGVTVAIGLSVAGLLFSVYYKPYLRSQMVSGSASSNAKRKSTKDMFEQR